MLSEEQINSTKLLCAGVKTLCIYNQDQQLWASVEYHQINELVLPASNLLWVVLRTDQIELFLEIARREEFVVKLMQSGVHQHQIVT